jgi:uncharacterized protein (TIGR03382 family)
MLRRATLLLCLLPGAALAQTTVGTPTAAVASATATPLPPAGYASRSNCADTTTAKATWNIASSITPTVANGDKWRLAVFSGSCDTANVPSAGGAASVYQDVLATGATQSLTNLVPVATMATKSGVLDCSAANDVTIAICVYFIPGSGSTTTAQLAAQGPFVFQLARPPPPTITKVTPGDSQLAVNVVPGTATATETATTSITYTATCTPSGSGQASTGGPSGSGTIICSGLANSIAYTVTAQAFSLANNPSADSTAVGPGAATTPLPFQNFWEVYKGQGGAEQGGCSTGGAGALAPALALLGLLAVRRRRS